MTLIVSQPFFIYQIIIVLQHGSDSGEEIASDGKDLEKGIPEYSAEFALSDSYP